MIRKVEYIETKWGKKQVTSITRTLYTYKVTVWYFLFIPIYKHKKIVSAI